jgi:hypothetical protein
MIAFRCYRLAQLFRGHPVPRFGTDKSSLGGKVSSDSASLGQRVRSTLRGSYHDAPIESTAVLLSVDIDNVLTANLPRKISKKTLKHLTRTDDHKNELTHAGR